MDGTELFSAAAIFRSMVSDLESRFRAHASRLLPERGRILVAVSGGMDSVVALHLLKVCFPESTLAIAHFDHGVRPDSAADATWVRALGDRLGIAVLSETAGPTSHTENAWRQARYAFLGRAADTWKADTIVTAHHADDQAETVLFRIARGAGTHGLRGIPERRGILVRPLLPFRRGDLHAYARARELAWREDSTNADPSHARNRIRHQLLPALEAASPGAVDRLLEISGHAAETEMYWRRQLRGLVREAVTARDGEGFTLAAGVLRGYHPRIRARVLRSLCGRLGSMPDAAGTRRAVRFIDGVRSGAVIPMAPGLRLERSFDRLLLTRDHAGPGSADSATIAIASTEPGAAEISLAGRRVRVRWTLETEPMSGEGAQFDPAGLTFPLELRGWRPGDQI
ncbi:MAG: tRNA lysidine(34) synthetase TilS, partial [Longimicrobiales bacterium]